VSCRHDRCETHEGRLLGEEWKNGSVLGIKEVFFSVRPSVCTGGLDYLDAGALISRSVARVVYVQGAVCCMLWGVMYSVLRKIRRNAAGWLAMLVILSRDLLLLRRDGVVDGGAKLKRLGCRRGVHRQRFRFS
jgi:hypothetical protein